MPLVLALSCGRLTPPLSLSVTVWRTGAFAGEFGDAFIKDTELEGGHTAPALRLVIDILKEMMGGTNAGPLMCCTTVWGGWMLVRGRR